MDTRTKSKLVRAARSVLVAAPVMAAASMLPGPSWGNVVGPYSSDGNTAVLLHLDETPGAITAVNTGGYPANAIAFNQSSVNVVGTTSTAILGATGASGFTFGNFGNAATFTGNLFLGFDTNNNGTYQPDLNTNTTNTNPSADAIASTQFTDSGTGAFTLEALVNIPTAFTSGSNHEIISYDSSNNTPAQRGFQFRFNQASATVLNLQYDNIADSLGSVTLPVPTTGPDAFALNTWFHVAMTYDGTGSGNSVRLYWTKLDDTALQAHLLGTGGQGDLTAAANPNVLTFGGENRNSAGEPLGGLLDEARISNRVRISSEFLFAGLVANYWNNAGGGDWDTAGNWTAGVPNAAAASAYFGGGITPPTQDSTVTLAGTKTVGLVVFDSSTFKYTLADGGSGSLVLDGGAGNPGTIQAIISGTPEIAVPVTIGTAGAIIQVGGSATLTISGNVSGGTNGLTKTDTGVLALTSTSNTYGGATSVAGGTLRATDGVTLPTSSNLVLNGGVLETGFNFARALGTAANQVQLPGGASGFVSSAANIQVAIGSIASPTALSWGGATFAPTALILQGTTAANTVTFLNPINLNGGTRTVQVNTGVATLSGNITNSTGTGNLIKTGGGTLVLTGSANTYGGTTTVSGGVFGANDGATLPTSTNLSLNGGVLQTTGNFTRALGTLPNQVQLPGGNSGFSTNGSDINVTITNGGNPILWGATTNTFSPAQLLFNSVGNNNINFTTDPIDLNGANRVLQVNAGTVTFNGQVTGATALLVRGAGMVVLTNSANGYSGGTGISDNAQNIPTIVRAAANNALGTGNISIGSQGSQSASRLQLINNINLPNSISFVGRRESQFNPAIENVSGNNELSGRLNIETGGQNWLAQSDSGVLTLSGAAPAAAGVAVTITAGAVAAAPRPITLQGAGDGVVSGVMSNGTTGNTLAAIKLGSGTWTLTNAGSTYTGPTSVGEGTLSVSALANGLLTSSLGAASNAAANLVVTGGTLKYTGPAVATDHLLRISAAGGALDASGSGALTFGNGGANESSDPANRATALDFNLATTSAVVQLPGVLDLVPGMTVSGAKIAPGTTILSVNKQLLQITLSANPIDVGTDTLSFGTADRVLTLTGSGDGVMGNALTNSAGGAKLGVNKTGSGTWSLTHSANTYTGATTVSNGTLRLQGNLTSSSSVVVSGGRLELTSNGTYLRMLRTPSVSVTGGDIDIQDNKLITQTPAGTWNGSSYTDVAGLVATGRNGTAWDGTGIVTSQTQAIGSNYTSIGVARASDVRPNTATETALWGGQTITGTDTLVMYTYGGDATLDGKINIDDYVKIDSGIAGGYTGWVNGDFNYDGKVSIDDYITVIDANIGNQNGVFPTASGLGGGVSGVSAVPEPAGISMIALAVGGLASRRRRRQR
jgi:fibronectin-binding autotransporter adhesin